VARKKLHIDKPLPGDVTRAPSDAENLAALKAKGWDGHQNEYSAAGIGQSEYEHGGTRLSDVRPPRPRPRIHPLAARGFRPL
jgi:hypothetical protein